MTVYQVSGNVAIIDGDYGNGTLTIADTINPITGKMGVNTVKILNASSEPATIEFTTLDTTYEYVDVPYTTDSSAGANASFTVTVTSSGYEVTIVDGGVDFVAADSISILGTDVGGTTTANDLTFTVETVDADTGAILTISAITGTQLWPQAITGSTVVPSAVDSFVQVTNTPSVGCYFTANNTGTGNVYVIPVAIVG